MGKKAVPSRQGTARFFAVMERRCRMGSKKGRGGNLPGPGLGMRRMDYIPAIPAVIMAIL